MSRTAELSELFPDSFLQETSTFANFEEFFVAVGADAVAVVQIEDLDTQRVNRIIAERTDFASWSDMLRARESQLFASRIYNRVQTKKIMTLRA